ncbi:hypothetical protein APY03_3651 [Variovorax sp. WDL1]|nr:hypothetical protein APY03_3651 [Variovorax sp. WDL1]
MRNIRRTCSIVKAALGRCQARRSSSVSYTARSSSALLARR